MYIIFPIGGRGERFREAGYSQPKPLIRIGEKRLIDLVLESYSAHKPSDNLKHVFIIKKELRQAFPPLTSFILREDTLGPVGTLLNFPALLNTEEEVLIADCDSVIEPDELEKALTYFRWDPSFYGGSPLRQTEDLACSYARVDETFKIIETKEKEPISNWSTTGPYWFRHGYHLLKAMEQAAMNQIWSISPCFNYLIRDELKVVGYPVKTFQHLGTPEALEKYANDHSLALSK